LDNLSADIQTIMTANSQATSQSNICIFIPKQKTNDMNNRFGVDE